MELVAAAFAAAGSLLMRPGLKASFAQLHRSAGSVFGVVLFIILFSGTWSLGGDSLRLWWQHLPAGEPLPLSVLTEPGMAQLSGESGGHIVLPSDRYPVISVCRHPGDCPVLLSAVTGQPVSAAAPTDIPVTLHKNLFLGFPGRILVSLTGVVLTVLLITGLVIHHRKIRLLLRLRWRQGIRRFAFDLHNLTGLWCYPWLVLFALTGALSGVGAFGTMMLADRVSPQAPQQIMQQLMGSFREPDAAGEPVFSSVTELLAQLPARYPGFIPQMVSLQNPGRDDRVVTISGVREGQPGSAYFEQLRWQGTPLRLTGIRDSAEQGIWTRAFIAVQPLHYGQYTWLAGAAPWLSALHFLAGFAACLLTLSGLSLRALNAPDSLSSRLTIGLCGGPVLACTVLLLSAWFSPLSAPAVFPAVWLITVFFHPFVPVAQPRTAADLFVLCRRIRACGAGSSVFLRRCAVVYRCRAAADCGGVSVMCCCVMAEKPLPE
ncbi:PepSY domain-containing protein [Morganella morganii]|uniref:PepSY-associated TM helix domain-containing protein n=1 Tax=Morganella morganii TaxID=582 RepID=UPI001C76B232|nr:PepSY-associated TM helix domain-containing protein [Morganella morganii]QXO42879.1 PepSY domain-containing protein [Morganella morganii]